MYHMSKTRHFRQACRLRAPQRSSTVGSLHPEAHSVNACQDSGCTEQFNQNWIEDTQQNGMDRRVAEVRASMFSGAGMWLLCQLLLAVSHVHERGFRTEPTHPGLRSTIKSAEVRDEGRVRRQRGVIQGTRSLFYSVLCLSLIAVQKSTFLIEAKSTESLGAIEDNMERKRVSEIEAEYEMSL